MNASLHLASMEHARTYLMTTSVLVVQGILAEIVQCWQQHLIVATHTLVSMEPHALKTLMALISVIVLQATLAHIVKLTSLSA